MDTPLCVVESIEEMKSIEVAVETPMSKSAVSLEVPCMLLDQSLYLNLYHWKGQVQNQNINKIYFKQETTTLDFLEESLDLNGANITEHYKNCIPSNTSQIKIGTHM